MKVFLSYASEQLNLAERTCRLLESEGHDVFFDRASLRAGDAYGERIRTAVARSDLFVFFVSHESIAAPSYALTELAIVERLSRRRRPLLLPVLTEPIDLEALPAVLKPLTLLEPKGDMAAEIGATVNTVRQNLRWRLYARFAAPLAVAVLAIGATWWLRQAAAPPAAVTADPIQSLNAAVQRNIPDAERVTISGSLSNSGWFVTILVADLGTREVLYRLDDEETFQSTGHHSHRNLLTGLPQYNMTINIPGSAGQEHEIEIKYIDSDGQEHGPYMFHFDPRAEYVRDTKRTLEQVVTDWVEFFEDEPGKLQLSFGAILSSKNAFREIRYSLDSEALERRVRFAPSWSQKGAPGSDERDEGYVVIPAATRYVAIKLFYVDGTESELKRYQVPTFGNR